MYEFACYQNCCCTPQIHSFRLPSKEVRLSFFACWMLQLRYFSCVDWLGAQLLRLGLCNMYANARNFPSSLNLWLVFSPDIIALKHESRKLRYFREVEKSSRSFSSQSCQAAAGRSPNRPERKTSTLNFQTTQKYLIFLLSCFRTRMSGSFRVQNALALSYGRQARKREQEGKGPIDLRRQGPWEMDIWCCIGLIRSQTLALCLLFLTL